MPSAGQNAAVQVEVEPGDVRGRIGGGCSHGFVKFVDSYLGTGRAIDPRYTLADALACEAAQHRDVWLGWVASTIATAWGWLTHGR